MRKIHPPRIHAGHGGMVVACLVRVGGVLTFLVNLFISCGDFVPVAVSYLQVWIFCLIGVGLAELLTLFSGRLEVESFYGQYHHQ